MNYNKTNVDDIKKIYDQEINRKKTLDEKYAPIKDEDSTRVRILPANKQGRAFFVKSGYHKIGDEYVTCPKMSRGLRCPVCELVSKLYKSKNIADVELAGQLKAKKRFYFNVVVRGEEEKGARVLVTGIKLYEKVLASIVDPEIGDITDPMNGFDFIISKKMKAGYWNYDDSVVARKQSKLDEDPAKAAATIEKQHDLEDEIKLFTFEELKQKLDEFFATNITESAPAMRSAEDAVVVKNVMPGTIITEKVVAAPVNAKPAEPAADADLDSFISTINKLREESGA